MKKSIAFLLTTIFGAALWAQTTPAAPVPTPPEELDYAFGILLGQSLATTGLEFNFDHLLQGIKDSLNKGGPAKVTPEKAREIVTAFLQARQEKASQALADKETAWLANHAKAKGVVTTASGLQYEVLTVGTGKKPVGTDTVKVNYVGTLVDGTEFDSSYKRGEPAEFALDQVIPAWTEGIQLMPVGAKYRFTIPSSLAYGAQGAGEVIPPFSTLLFEVELLAIQPPAPAPKN